jgi:hypothetical protein
MLFLLFSARSPALSRAINSRNSTNSKGCTDPCTGVRVTA